MGVRSLSATGQKGRHLEENLTGDVVERGQRLGAEVNGGRPLPHLLHQQLAFLFLQQLHEELVRRDDEQQGELLQVFTQHSAMRRTS